MARVDKGISRVKTFRNFSQFYLNIHAFIHERYAVAFRAEAGPRFTDAEGMEG